MKGAWLVLVSYAQITAYSGQSQYSQFQYGLSSNHEPLPSKQSPLDDDSVSISSAAVLASERAELPQAERLSGAEHILSFISQGIAAFKAEGASDQVLLEKISEAKEGFLKGYSEASDQLDASNQLNEAVRNSIVLLKSQVLEGLDHLVQSIAQKESFDQVEYTEKPLAVAAHHILEKTSGQTFDFELTTQEGDIISINANQAMHAYAEQTQSNQSHSIERSSGLAITVRGDLNDSELKAINDLLDQVMSLSNDFYNGRVEEAFNAALDLGYDNSEIGAFAVKLTQVEYIATETHYTLGSPKHEGSLSATAMRSLSDYAEKLLDSVALNDHQHWLEQLAMQLDKQQSTQAFSQFLSSAL